MRSIVTLVLVLLCCGPMCSAAAAQEGPQVVAHQRLVALLNPMGLEHRFDLGVRESLGDQSDIFFHGAHVQTGITTFVAPVYLIGGGYVEVSPLSFLVLRGELLGAGIWPIGMNGAGHYALGGYDGDVRAQSLPGEEGQSASGWTASVSATLQGAVDVGEHRLLMMSELGFARALLGDDAFYYSMKYDLVLAREDYVLTNSAFLGVELRAAPDFVVRLGAYDDLRHVPASGYVGHQVGGLAMVEWEHPGPGVGSLAIFVRGGGYTHHVTRQDEATILGGVAVDYDLGGL